MALVFEGKQNVYNIPYIHYKSSDVYWNLIYRDFKANNKTVAASNNVLKRYLNSLQKKIKIYKRNANGQIQQVDLKNITQGNFLYEKDADQFFVQILEQMAVETQRRIDASATAQQRYATLDQAMLNLSDSAKILYKDAGESADKKTLQTFFKGLEQLLSIYGKIDKKVWAEFQKFNLFSGNEEQIKAVLDDFVDNKGLIQVQFQKNTDSYDRVKSIMGTLARIPDNVKNVKPDKNGNINPSRSINSSITNITSTITGEFLGVLDFNMVYKIDEEINKALGKNLSKNGRSAKASGASQVSQPIKGIQGKQKVDVVKTGAIEISMEMTPGGNKEQFIIAGEIAASIKYYKDLIDRQKYAKSKRRRRSSKGKETDISAHTTEKFTVYAKSIFKHETARYGIYNTLAFHNIGKPQEQGSFHIIYSSIIATFLDQFIAGSRYEEDVAAMIIINGKIYPIVSIIQAYLNELNKLPENFNWDKSGPFNAVIKTSFNFSNLNNVNKFEEDTNDKNKKDLTLALKRSKQVQAAADAVSMTMKIDKATLIKLALHLKDLKPL